MDQDGNVFDFTRQYKNWLEFEKISNRTYNDLENLMVVLSVLENDGRFDKALQAITMKKNLYEQMLNIDPTAPFPPPLTIDTIPYTIMNSYNASEKRDLFGTSSTVSNPTINKLNTVRNPYKTNSNPSTPPRGAPRDTVPPMRGRLNVFCKGCGQYGHDIFQNGCDFTASYIKAKAFIEKNPQLIQKIAREQFKYQLARKKNLGGSFSFAQRVKQNAQSRNVGFGPHVKALIDVLGEILEYHHILIFVSYLF